MEPAPPPSMAPDAGDIVEWSPAPFYHRFGRFPTKKGEGATKTVFEAADVVEGKLVAWNEVDTQRLSPEERERVHAEVALLQEVKHPHIIDFYASWTSPSKVVFITAIIESGDLQRFYRTHAVKLKVIKKWCRQILDGLAYLHTRFHPPIIHRDIKCENVLYSAADGTVRIGDLGLSTRVADDCAADLGGAVLGTPNYMAPELYEGRVDEGVDVYAFGMCVLEMATRRLPYDECTNSAQIYRKVTQGILPEAFHRIRLASVREFIEFCVTPRAGPDGGRPSAREVAAHPFLAGGGGGGGAVASAGGGSGTAAGAAADAASSSSGGCDAGGAAPPPGAVAGAGCSEDDEVDLCWPDEFEPQQQQQPSLAEPGAASTLLPRHSSDAGSPRSPGTAATATTTSPTLLHSQQPSISSGLSPQSGAFVLGGHPAPPASVISFNEAGAEAHAVGGSASDSEGDDLIEGWEESVSRHPAHHVGGSAAGDEFADSGRFLPLLPPRSAVGPQTAATARAPGARAEEEQYPGAVPLQPELHDDDGGRAQPGSSAVGEAGSSYPPPVADAGANTAAFQQPRYHFADAGAGRSRGSMSDSLGRSRGSLSESLSAMQQQLDPGASGSARRRRQSLGQGSMSSGIGGGGGISRGELETGFEGEFQSYPSQPPSRGPASMSSLSEVIAEVDRQRHTDEGRHDGGGGGGEASTRGPGGDAGAGRGGHHTSESAILAAAPHLQHHGLSGDAGSPLPPTPQAPVFPDNPDAVSLGGGSGGGDGSGDGSGGDCGAQASGSVTGSPAAMVFTDESEAGLTSPFSLMGGGSGSLAATLATESHASVSQLDTARQLYEPIVDDMAPQRGFHDSPAAADHDAVGFDAVGAVDRTPSHTVPSSPARTPGTSMLLASMSPPPSIPGTPNMHGTMQYQYSQGEPHERAIELVPEQPLDGLGPSELQPRAPPSPQLRHEPLHSELVVPPLLGVLSGARFSDAGRAVSHEQHATDSRGHHLLDSPLRPAGHAATTLASSPSAASRGLSISPDALSMTGGGGSAADGGGGGEGGAEVDGAWRPLATTLVTGTPAGEGLAPTQLSPPPPSPRGRDHSGGLLATSLLSPPPPGGSPEPDPATAAAAAHHPDHDGRHSAAPQQYVDGGAPRGQPPLPDEERGGGGSYSAGGGPDGNSGGHRRDHFSTGSLLFSPPIGRPGALLSPPVVEAGLVCGLADAEVGVTEGGARGQPTAGLDTGATGGGYRSDAAAVAAAPGAQPPLLFSPNDAHTGGAGQAFYSVGSAPASADSQAYGAERDPPSRASGTPYQQQQQQQQQQRARLDELSADEQRQLLLALEQHAAVAQPPSPAAAAAAVAAAAAAALDAHGTAPPQLVAGPVPDDVAAPLPPSSAQQLPSSADAAPAQHAPSSPVILLTLAIEHDQQADGQVTRATMTFEFDRTSPDVETTARAIVASLLELGTIAIDASVVPMLAAFLQAQRFDAAVKIATGPIPRLNWRSLRLEPLLAAAPVAAGAEDDAPAAQRVRRPSSTTLQPVSIPPGAAAAATASSLSSKLSPTSALRLMSRTSSVGESLPVSRASSSVGDSESLPAARSASHSLDSASSDALSSALAGSSRVALSTQGGGGGGGGDGSARVVGVSLVSSVGLGGGGGGGSGDSDGGGEDGGPASSDLGRRSAGVSMSEELALLAAEQDREDDGGKGGHHHHHHPQLPPALLRHALVASPSSGDLPALVDTSLLSASGMLAGDGLATSGPGDILLGDPLYEHHLRQQHAHDS